MHDRFNVARIGADQVRIKGGRPGSKALGRILAWAISRPEVLEAHRRATGAIDIRLRGGEVQVEFLSSLEDRLFAIEHPTVPVAGFAVEVVHALPGRVRLRIAGLDDDGIVRLAAFLRGQPGVLRVSPSPAARSIVVVYDEATTADQALVDIAAAGAPASWPEAVAERPRASLRSAVTASAVMGAAFAGFVPEAALAAGIAVTALPPLRRAIAALRERRVSVDILDVAAVSISVATGQPATAAFITWLLSIGDLLLARSADSARAAISRLVSLDTPEALRLTGNRAERVPAAKLVRGDRLLVPTGHRIAADAIIRSGIASVDEKALTGESLPRACGIGDRVLAATVVLEGELVIEVERAGGDTTAAKIVKLLDGAGQKPMTLQKNAERITDRLTLPTIGVAGGAAMLTGEIARATSVLITDFGTGVRLALPASALTAMALAARAGVLVKGAQYLERLAATDVVVFDKTGTLTSGTPHIIDVTPLDGSDGREALALCAGAEAQAAHPVAHAIRSHAAAAGIDVLEAEVGSCQYAIGRGLSARVDGRTVLVGSQRWLREHQVDLAAAVAPLAAHRARGASSLLVAVDGALRAALAYADRPRSESAMVVRALKARGRRVVLLSGDSKHAVEAVAHAVGVDDARGEMLPEDKADYVKDLKRGGAVVAVVGDGINDAPALALADVGISLHGSTDVALETADVVLLDGGLEKLVAAFDAGERAMRHVRRGLGIVVVPNAVAIVLGALGLIGPGAAAIANNGSTVVAALAAVAPILNPLRDRGKR